MAAVLRILAVLPLVTLGYRDSSSAFPALEVHAASAATPDADATFVQREQGSEWANDCEANPLTCAAVLIPRACNASFDSCRALLPTLQHLSIDENSKVRRKVATKALPAVCESGLCSQALLTLAALAEDAAPKVRDGVASHALPAACKAHLCKEILPMLVRLGKDQDSQVRGYIADKVLPWACGSRNKLCGQEEVMAAVVSLARDQSDSVRESVADRVIPAACRAGPWYCDAMLPTISQLASDKSDSVAVGIARYAVRAACRAGTELCEQVLPALIRLGRHSQSSVRIAAVESAPEACNHNLCEQVLPFLLSLSKDTSARVRFPAQESLRGCTQVNQLRAEHAVTGNLSIQVSQIMDFAEDHVLKVPAGVAMSLVGQLAAHRCPNRAACRGNEERPKEDPSGIQPTCGIRAIPPGPCAPGYDPEVPGCAGCKQGYGRAPTDPFECKYCGNYALNIGWFLIFPLGVFLLGMKSALNPQSERFGSLYRITISYSTSCYLILHALLSSRIGVDITKQARGVLDLPLAAADGTSGFAAGNIDCLLGRPADVGTWLLVTNAVPLSLLVTSVAVASAWGRIRSPEQSLVTLVLRPILVFTNSFLPSMLITFLRGWPCYHTQNIENYPSAMMYQVATPCPVYMSWPIFASVCGFTLILAIGPGLWCVLLFMAEGWGAADCRGRLGFLTGAYKPGKHWWEVVVLVRKLSFATIVALCPQSYSLYAHLLAVLMVLGIALVLHVMVKPYEGYQDGAWFFSLNVIEGGSLAISHLCLGATLYVATPDTWAGSQTIYHILALIAIFLLVAYGALLFCLLAYEGSAKLKNMVSGQTNAQKRSSEEQQAEDARASEERSAMDSPSPLVS